MWAVIILFAIILLMFMSAAYTEITNLKTEISHLKNTIDTLSYRVDYLACDVKAINENINLIEYGDTEKG